MNWLLSPLAWLLAAALCGAIAWNLRARWLMAGAIVVAFVAVAGMTPLVANLLVARLERPVTASPQCRTAPPATVVVLAGSVDRPPRNEVDFSALNLAARRRMERAVQYWRAGQGRELVVAGGPLAAGPASRAKLMREHARWLGVPGRALRIEARSRNTWQNARNVARLEPPVPHRITLVTSALHMPRARASFDAVGFDVCPLPADFRAVPVAPPGYLLPRTSALIKTEAALHELVGTAWYRWRGWLDPDPVDEIRGRSPS